MGVEAVGFGDGNPVRSDERDVWKHYGGEWRRGSSVAKWQQTIASTNFLHESFRSSFPERHLPYSYPVISALQDEISRY